MSVRRRWPARAPTPAASRHRGASVVRPTLIERGSRGSSVPSAIPSTPPRSSAIARHPRGTARCHRRPCPMQREIGAEDARVPVPRSPREPTDPEPRRRLPPRDRDRVGEAAGRTSSSPASVGRGYAARASDGGCAGRARLASASAAAAAGTVTRHPEIPALSLEQAGGPLRDRRRASTPAMARRPEFDRRPGTHRSRRQSPRARTRTSIGSTGVGAGRRDALPQLDRAQISTMGIEIGVTRLGLPGSLDHRRTGRGASSPAASQW